MGFTQDNGYIPVSIDTIMLEFMDDINTQFNTTYVAETFVGTNHYKYFYAIAQRYETNEIKTSEIFLYLQQYFNIINQRISRPVATSPGIVERLGVAGYIASLKPMIDADAGKISVAVDILGTETDYAARKLAINTLISQITAGGTVTQGAEVSAIVLSNGQSFNFKFSKANRILVLLKLTITTSENNQVVINDPDTVKTNLINNIHARYRLGKNFEPQRYFSLIDAPWASNVLLEWSSDAGATWHSTVYDANFDDLFDVKLANITVVEN